MPWSNRGVGGVPAGSPRSTDGGAGAGAGEGRVLACLRQNRPKLQAECRKEELQLSLVAAGDVRLRPKLRKLCSEEITVYCTGVKPGAPADLACAPPPISASPRMCCPQSLRRLCAKARQETGQSCF